MAIKTVVFTSAGGDAQTGRVASEAAIASNLSHPNVVATYSHDILDVARSVGAELGVYKFYLIQVRICPNGIGPWPSVCPFRAATGVSLHYGPFTVIIP